VFNLESPSVDLRKLEIFICVAEQQSFSQAAKKLHMAQPAVSIAVRKLEEELGTTLLERDNKAIRLTSEGQTAMAQAKQILMQVGELKDSMSELNGLLKGELNIACPSMLATYYFPDLLEQFLSRQTGLTASIIQAGTKRIESMLLQDEVELGVISLQGSHDGLEVIPLIKEQIVLCVGKNHEFNQKKRIHINTLNQLPMVLYQQDYFIRQMLDQACTEHSVLPDIRMQTNFLPLLTRMVKNGMGASVGLKIMAEQEQGIHGITLTPKMELQMAVAWKKGKRISKANQAFVDWLLERKD